jgi:DNA-binding GntR family transcriptional regulator
MSSRPKKKPASRAGKMAGRVFNRLVEAIVTGSIPSGQPFREAQFAKRWGVSRTPMREAVRRAAEGGFVVLRRNRTPIIRSLSGQEITSLYELRELLETFAFKQAFGQIPPKCIAELEALAQKSRREDSADWIALCLRLDRRLHLSWIENCNNPWLTESLARIWNFIRILQRYMAKDADLVKQSAKEHRQILKALVSGDKQRGVEQLRRHIRNSRGAVVACVRN